GPGRGVARVVRDPQRRQIGRVLAGRGADRQARGNAVAAETLPAGLAGAPTGTHAGAFGRLLAARRRAAHGRDRELLDSRVRIRRAARRAGLDLATLEEVEHARQQVVDVRVR